MDPAACFLCIAVLRESYFIFSTMKTSKQKYGTAVDIKRLDGLSSVTSSTLPIKFNAVEWKEIPQCSSLRIKVLYMYSIYSMCTSHLAD